MTLLTGGSNIIGNKGHPFSVYIVRKGAHCLSVVTELTEYIYIYTRGVYTPIPASDEKRMYVCMYVCIAAAITGLDLLLTTTFIA